jgi:tetraacyldisaccharide 4'-kinase
MPPRPFHFLSLIRFLLYPFALIYGVIVWLRNRLYDSGFFSSVEFSLPVICVGNLSVGGTGKTPHVEYLLRLLQYQYRVATMSRGYKRSTQGFLLADENSNALRIGDEPMQYHLGFPEAVVSVAEERMTGIPLLLQRRPEVEVIILDDAYQHRSVKAGLNILISDFSQPFFRDYILPYGRLREGRAAAQRAQAIVVSKCPPSLSRSDADAMLAEMNPLPEQQVFFSAIRYAQAYALMSRTPVDIRGKSVLLVCGIARPEPLVAHLQEQAAAVHTLSFRDHHYFGSRDLEEMREAFENWPAEDKIILTTEKDATRLLLHRERLAEMNLPFAVLPIEVGFLFGEGPRFDRMVERFVSSVRTEELGIDAPEESDVSGERADFQ